MQSHLLQMRGLKQQVQAGTRALEVASFTDAWIETVQKISLLWWRTSHLLQMRGLKQFQPIKMFDSFSRIFYRCVD